MFPTFPSYQATRPTLSPIQTKLWGESPICQDNSPLLDKVGKKFIQEVYGVFLFYVWCIDRGLLSAFSSRASQQASQTKTQCHSVRNFLITCHGRMTSFSHSKPVTWCYQSTVMPPTSPNLKHTAAQEDTCSWQVMTPPDKITELSSRSPKSFVPSWTAKLGALIINTKTAVSLHRTLIELSHPSLEHLYKPTTPQPMHFLPTIFSQRHAKPWIWDFIGCNVAKNNCSSITPGGLEQKLGRLLHQASPCQPPHSCW